MLKKSASNKIFTDHGRIRTCNPQIRSLMPYPLGHVANLTLIVDLNILKTKPLKDLI